MAKTLLTVDPKMAPWAQETPTRTLISPNLKEVSFLNSSEKKDEYLEHLMKLNLPKDAVVVDVGANVGAFSCALSRHLGSEARVFAIEPFKQTFDCLSKNTEGFPVKCCKFAIGTDEGMLEGTFLPEYTLLSGFHVTGEDQTELEMLTGRSLDKEFTVIKETVPCVRLDNFLTQQGIAGSIDVLKIDVEKAELDVILSLGSRLADVTCVVAEVHMPNLKQFKDILEARFGEERVWVSEKDLPCFLVGERPSEWSDSLSTYIVFAI
jgi:FkbM family methyltransferase